MIFENVDDLQLLNDAMEASGTAWWIMELPSGVVFFHPNKIKKLGYTDKDVEDFVHYTSFTNLIHPDDHAKTLKAMKDHIEGRADQYEASYRIKTKKGAYIQCFDRGKIVAKFDGCIALAGIVIEIPDRFLAKS